MVRELVDWRLSEYLARDASSDVPNSFQCRVIHSSGNPILKLPDRKKVSGIPEGWNSILVAGESYTANFVKQAVNVIRDTSGDEKNVIGDLMRACSAQMPVSLARVTKCDLRRRLVDCRWNRLQMAWEKVKHSYGNTTNGSSIPPLFGFEFKTGHWNQGFVKVENHVFLLVTLNKQGLTKEHQYDDGFVNDRQFRWQSQNSTSQKSNAGQIIRDPRAQGYTIHLCVRKAKLMHGKGAPFVYCGPVEFESWEGEKPISVLWNLCDAVPQRLWTLFEVPE